MDRAPVPHPHRAIDRCRCVAGGCDTDPMGFNPEHQHRRSPWDVVIVGAALAVCAGLVLWACFG